MRSFHLGQKIFCICYSFSKYFKVAVYGTNIRYESSKKLASKKYFCALKRIMSVLFASFIFLIEEVKNVYLFYKGGKVIQALRKKHGRFATLSLDEKKAVRDFFNSRIRQLDGAQRLICRESSIQVVLQLALILYQANYQEK